jgi:competence protein ComEC
MLFFFIFGVFVRSFFEIEIRFYFFAIFCALLFLALNYRNKNVWIFCALLGAFIFGSWKTENSLEKIKKLQFLEKEISEQVEVILSSENAFGQRIIFETQEGKIKVMTNIAQYPTYSYGDILKISNCRLLEIENRDETFDYKMFLAKEGVFYECKKPKVELVSNKGGNFLLRNILNLRKNFEEKIKNNLPQPESSLAVGILLGGSSGFSKDLQNAFSRTGTTHIVAVSGYNVTIIAEYLMLLGIFLGLWRKQAIWFALFGIAIFVFMVGLPASAVRAGVMGAILLWAMKNGRLASSENAILLTASIMLFLNPLLLRWDIGFQLSFLATLGIILAFPILEEIFIKRNKALGIFEAIFLTLSAQIFVLPIILYNFKTISIISVLANFFVLPLVPISMLLVFLLVLASFIFSPLSFIFAWIGFLPLYFSIEIIKIFSNLPFASLEFENPSFLLVVFYYLLVGAVFYLYKKYEKKKNNL